MIKYNEVAKNVEPKKIALKQAEQDLESTMVQLDAAKAKLQKVEKNVMDLESNFEEQKNQLKELEDSCKLCEQRLGRAETVIQELITLRNKF